MAAASKRSGKFLRVVGALTQYSYVAERDVKGEEKALELLLEALECFKLKRDEVQPRLVAMGLDKAQVSRALNHGRFLLKNVKLHEFLASIMGVEEVDLRHYLHQRLGLDDLAVLRRRKAPPPPPPALKRRRRSSAAGVVAVPKKKDVG